MDLNLDGKACRVVCWFVKECAVLFYVDKMREVENERNVKRFRSGFCVRLSVQILTAGQTSLLFSL